MNCDFRTSASGGFRCENCGREQPSTEKAACEAELPLGELLAMQRGERPQVAVRLTAWQAQRLWEQTGLANVLSPAEIRQVFGADDPTLLGNRVAQLTKAIGWPPCPACQARQKWLNRAHAWWRGF